MVDQSRIDAEIDLSAIRENLYSMLEGQDPEKKVIAVVKANAYGHGALRVASALEDEERLFGFAVATAAEALELREEAYENRSFFWAMSFRNTLKS